MNSKYSLIIPIYQVKEYLVQCLESIFCQIPQDVQVILVDDGSTDGSGEICDEYAQRYPQIEVIHQENKGVAAARNAGLAAAKGEYLLWVDPDDLVTEHWFEKIAAVVDLYSPDVIVFDSMRFGINTRQEIYGRSEGFVDRDLFLCDLARDIRILSGLPCKVIRISLYQGISFDSSLDILEDYSIVFPLLQSARTVYYIRDVLYLYRQHDTSLLHRQEPKKSFACVKVAECRWSSVDSRYKAAAAIGVVIQAFLYCRAAAYNSHYIRNSKEYQYCIQLIQKHLGLVLRDHEVPFVWKLKCTLMSAGLLHGIIKIKCLIMQVLSKRNDK